MKNKIKKIYGWSQSTSDYSNIFYVENKKDIFKVIELAKSENKKISNIGSGKSYGDNFLNNEISISYKEFKKILNYDKENKTISVEPGFTIDDLLRTTVADGLIFPVLPGVRYASVGGCLSNNTHGKNISKNNYFGNYVKSLKVILSDGRELSCDRNNNSDLFFSIISGLGLIGFVFEVTLNLDKIETYFLDQYQIKNKGIDNLIRDFETIAYESDFSLALIDNGSILNKNQGYKLTHTNYSEKVSKLTLEQHEVTKFMFGIIPKAIVPLILKFPFMKYLMYQFTGLWSSGIVGYFNKTTVSISDYNFQFDQVMPKYNYFFKNGLIEYHCMVPKIAFSEFYNKTILKMRKEKLKTIFTSLKYYKKSSENFLLSFEPEEDSIGLSIHFENKNKDKLDSFINQLNEYVLEYNGKVYFAKNININSYQLKKMYPNYSKFDDMKKKYDTENLLTSNLYKRIFLEDSKYYGQY